MQNYSSFRAWFFCVLSLSMKSSHGFMKNSLVAEKELDLGTEEHAGNKQVDNLSEETLIPVPGTGVMGTFDNLSIWAEREETFFSLAKDHVKKLKEELRSLESYIVDYETSTGETGLHFSLPLEIPKERTDFIASCGIASYRMTYRYTNTLQKLKELAASNHLDTELLEMIWNKNLPNAKEEVNQEYKTRLSGAILPDWPLRFDLIFAWQSLNRIQEVYNYDYKYLPTVLSPETRQPPELNAFHCAQLGLHALYKERYALAVEWIEFAIRKVNFGHDLSIPLSSLETYLELASEKHNQLIATAMYSKNVKAEHLFVRAVEPFQDIERSDRERLSTVRLRHNGGKKEAKYDWVNFNGICSGMIFRAPEAALYCWLDKTSSPVRRIFPLKKELLSTDPYEVVQVYDFVGEKMISEILAVTKDCLTLPHTSGDAKYSKFIRTRTSTSCWPPENSILEWRKKVEMLTLTDLNEPGSSEKFKVAEYTYGKFYGPHLDAIKVPDYQHGPSGMAALRKNGDRLFSVLFYLNDVPGGGFTPFCSAGFAAIPVKGSVVIWSNVYRNGSARDDNGHGSCPVTYGRKQIVSKLIRHNSQFRTYPCTSNQFE